MDKQTKSTFADSVKVAVAQSEAHNDLVCVVFTPEVAETHPGKLLYWLRHFLSYNRNTMLSGDFTFARSEQTLIVSSSLVKDKRNVVIRF